jgi:hypothetical protein
LVLYEKDHRRIRRHGTYIWIHIHELLIFIFIFIFIFFTYVWVPQNVYQTSFQKYPLLLVTCKTYMKDIKPFILNQLKDLQSKNSNNGESNHRIVAVFNLQCFLYDLGKSIGEKLGMKNILFDFVKNRLASTVTEYPLCWYTCISYVSNSKKVEMKKMKKQKCNTLNNLSSISIVIRS